MKTSNDLKQWRKDGQHLPPFMRDFHDQKDLFKAIHDIYSLHEAKDHRAPIGFSDAMIYTIDNFLWFMAAHGYTLQRCRAKQEFVDIHATISEATEKRNSHFMKLLTEGLSQTKAKQQ